MAYSAISKPQLHFDVLNYTGNGATSSAGTTARTLTGLGFQPSWVWVKEENDTEQHFLQDAVRGVTKVLTSSSTGSQADCLTDYSSGGINTFTSDGFTLGSGTGGNANNINTNGNGYRNYCWKGAGSSTTNNDGTVATSVQVNASAGFSIVDCDLSSASGSVTLGHGLGVTPEFIIAKSKYTAGSAGSWFCFHKVLPTNEYLALNTNTGQANDSGVWGSSPVNNNTFQISNVSNWGGNRVIAYCFASKKGYQKIGNYKGNGNASGTFVYTGFKPAYVLVKRYDSTPGNWCQMDIKNDGFNPTNKQIHPNTNGVETLGSGTTIDILSNGFKCRVTDDDKNGGSNKKYIYHAIAAEPLVANVTGNGMPATAN